MSYQLFPCHPNFIRVISALSMSPQLASRPSLSLTLFFLCSFYPPGTFHHLSQFLLFCSPHQQPFLYLNGHVSTPCINIGLTGATLWNLTASAESFVQHSVGHVQVQSVERDKVSPMANKISNRSEITVLSNYVPGE